MKKELSKNQDKFQIDNFYLKKFRIFYNWYHANSSSLNLAMN
jgi:hypothetical protein